MEDISILKIYITSLKKKKQKKTLIPKNCLKTKIEYSCIGIGKKRALSY